jgi:hypothetical protein
MTIGQRKGTTLQQISCVAAKASTRKLHGVSLTTNRRKGTRIVGAGATNALRITRTGRLALRRFSPGPCYFYFPLRSRNRGRPRPGRSSWSCSWRRSGRRARCHRGRRTGSSSGCYRCRRGRSGRRRHCCSWCWRRRRSRCSRRRCWCGLWHATNIAKKHDSVVQSARR